MREEGGIDPAKDEIAVGHRQRTALAIAGGAWIGPGAIGPDAEAAGLVMADRSAARGDRVDLHHRRGDAHARHDAVAGQLVFARIMRDIGARPAHVETDELVMAERRARRDHADHAARGARQDRILAAKGANRGEAAIRLHEAQALQFGQARLERVGVALEHRREIGVDHRGIAARDQPDERGDFVAGADLREARLACEFGQPRFMVAIFPAMHQHDGDSVEALAAQLGESGASGAFVELLQHLAIGADALRDLDHFRGQLFGQHDMACEDLGPRLVADPQRIAKALGDRQRKPFTLAFEQRIGRHGGADPHLGDRPHAMPLHQPTDRLARRIGIMLGIFRQQLVGHQLAAGCDRDHVGEGPAAIDCEAPGARIRCFAHARRFACAARKIKLHEAMASRSALSSDRGTSQSDLNLFALAPAEGAFAVLAGAQCGGRRCRKKSG